MKIESGIRPAPSRGIRLLLWFGIYLAAQLPLIPFVYRLIDDPTWLLFPMGMQWGFMLLEGSLIPRSIWDGGGERFRDWAFFVAAALPWVLYTVHLIISLCSRKRRSFLILIWILGAIVLFNLASCANFIEEVRSGNLADGREPVPPTNSVSSVTICEFFSQGQAGG